MWALLMSSAPVPAWEFKNTDKWKSMESMKNRLWYDD